MSAVLPESIQSENAPNGPPDAAEAWGEEDAIQGNGSCAPQYFIPGSLQWDAYQVGYSRGQQLIGTLREYDPSTARHARNAMPQRLPQDNPGIWALRGYEDALSARSVRSRLPPIHDPDHANYHAGYTEGAAMLKSIQPNGTPRRAIPGCPLGA